MSSWRGTASLRMLSSLHLPWHGSLILTPEGNFFLTKQFRVSLWGAMRCPIIQFNLTLPKLCPDPTVPGFMGMRLPPLQMPLNNWCDFAFRTTSVWIDWLRVRLPLVAVIWWSGSNDLGKHIYGFITNEVTEQLGEKTHRKQGLEES